MKRLFELRWNFAPFRRLAPWIARIAAPCPEISRLASESCDRPLGWRERWRMRWHFIICDWCRRYARQVRHLHEAAPRLATEAPQLQRRRLPVEAKERMKRRLQGGEGRAEAS